MLDVPVLPLMPAIFFALVNKIPTQLNWQPFVVLETFLQALSAVFVCLLMQKLTNSRKWALCGGLAWGLYPAAIVASGRYLTEIPTVFFLLGLTWSASRLLEFSNTRSISYFIKGMDWVFGMALSCY